MEKALKFEKSCGRMTHTFRRGFLKKPLRIKNDRIKAQRSGFDSERKNRGNGYEAVGLRQRLTSGCGTERAHSDARPGVAQLVARLLWEQDAAGSNPVTRTKKEESPPGGSSFFIERRLRTCGIPFLIAVRPCRRLRGTAAGSNPVTRDPIRRMMVPFVQSADRFSMIFMITTIRFRDIETISNKKRILFTEKIEIYIVFVVFLLYDVLNEPEEDTNDYIY